VLDEGIDVPAADLAVILAASRSRRQMVQRMGRVLRRKPDGRLARFVVVSVEGTVEDPAHGAHANFLDEITTVADSLRSFPAGSVADVCAFAGPGRPAA
jgi:superfamily II DNA or RNA helicase